jgi:hypothetical protein
MDAGWGSERTRCSRMRAVELATLGRSLAVTLGGLVIAMAAAPPASAHCGLYDPCQSLAFSNLTPPVDTDFVAGEPHPDWTMNAAPGLTGVEGRVSTSPETGPDGHTLSDLHEVRGAEFYFFESTTDERLYRTMAGVPHSWLPPGTYYWQIEAVGQASEYQTSIYTFAITPKLIPEPLPAPTPTSTPPPRGLRTRNRHHPLCQHGFVKARIGGKTKCLHSRESCSWRHRQQYRRYHFACVRRGKHYRLVRRR